MFCFAISLLEPKVKCNGNFYNLCVNSGNTDALMFKINGRTRASDNYITFLSQDPSAVCLTCPLN